MGIILTLIYVGVAYLAPATVFGDFAQYHIEVYLGLLTTLATIFTLRDSAVWKLPQTYGIFGLVITVACSLAFNGLLGLAPAALLQFVPNAAAFFFVLINFRTRAQLKALIVLMFIVATVVIVVGGTAIHDGDASSSYLMSMRNEQGIPFYRLCGRGFLNDPNDLAQFFTGLVPALFIFWRPGKWITNVLSVLLPVSFLFYGMFLTHSRGSMVGILVVALIAFRRKIGTAPAIILSSALFAGLSAVGWAGGRSVSAESGADRLEAWSTGLQLIRSHPIFGVGFSRFAEYYIITAHNTIVVCAAELGVVGLFCWCLTVVPTFRDLLKGAKSQRTDHEKSFPELPYGLESRAPLPYAPIGPTLPSYLAESEHRNPVAVGQTAFARASVEPAAAAFAERNSGLTGKGGNDISETEIRRLNRLMIASLGGLLATGWFLSRSYTMVLFVELGMAVAVYRMAVQRELAPAPLAAATACRYAAVACVCLLIVVYLILRVQHLFPSG